jgi:hypothetical protein
MRSLLVLAMLGLAACNSDWRAQAISNAEAMIRAQVNDPSLLFSRVQFTGDDRSGQTCGYFTRRTADGGEANTRFIVFIDGGGGQNPFVDDPSAPYPVNKDDFQLNWRTQCVVLGYTA